MATTDTTARGLLMLSSLPLLRLIPTTSADTTATMVLDTVPTDTDTPTLTATTATMARGPLMPSPLPPLRLRLIPTTDTTAWDTTDTDTTVLDTAPTATALVSTDTTDKCPADSNHPKTSLETTSSENGLFSLVHSPPVLPVSVPPG